MRIIGSPYFAQPSWSTRLTDDESLAIPYPVPIELRPAFAGSLPISELLDYVTSEFPATKMCRIDHATATLAAIDRIACDEAWQVEQLGRGDGRSHENATDLFNLGSAAELVRERRRVAAVTAARFLGRGTVRQFVHDVVGPLLCRRWLPLPCYSAGVSAATFPSPWKNPDFSLDAIAERAGRGTQPYLTGICDSLRAVPEVRQYLVGIEAKLFLDHSGQSVAEPPLLLASPNVNERIGHIMRGVVLPVRNADSRSPSALESESLMPALVASHAVSGGLRERDDRQWICAVGDFPGGTATPWQYRGPSAGLTLALALMGHALKPPAFASARVSPSGEVSSAGGVDGASEISQKLMALDLLARQTGDSESSVLLLGPGPDVDNAAKLIKAKELLVSLRVVRTVREALSQTTV